MIRSVIFDWSGTLVDDLPAVLEATNHVLVMAGQAPMALDRFRAEFRLPFAGFYLEHTPHIPMVQLEEWFHAKFRQVQGVVVELPHAREFLEFCRARGLKTLLLSTMHPEHFAAQVRVNHFDEFLDHPYLGIWDKRGKIREILQAHGLDPKETIFVGDMVHDIEAARHGGVCSVAVLTGYTRAAALRAAGADLMVEHLGELREILVRTNLAVPNTAAETASTANRRPVVTVGAAVFKDDGEVLVVRTHKWSDHWGIPGGKVKYGEASQAALRRELREETGLEVRDVEFVLVQDCISSREFYRDEHFVLLNYRCTAEPPAHVRLNDEAQEWRWLPLKEALAMDLNTPTRMLLQALHDSTKAIPDRDRSKATV